jgi:hypothetical protein
MRSFWRKVRSAKELSPGTQILHIVYFPPASEDPNDDHPVLAANKIIVGGAPECAIGIGFVRA